MPTLDELLDEESEETTEETAVSETENATIKAIRESQKKWEKAAKDATKLLRESEAKVTAFESAARESTAKAVFKEIGLSEKQAGLFLRVSEGEVTPESVRQFVQDYELADLSEEGVVSTEE